MRHNRILVALSFRDSSEPAFARALALAKASDAELSLLHVVPANQPVSRGAAGRRQRIDELRARAEAAGVSVQAFEEHGDPADVIVLHTRARPVDLVVLGSERRTGWARMFRPSVAERVLRRTATPALIVSGSDAGAGSAFRHLLVAVDLSPASSALLDTASHLLASDVRQLTAVHSVESAGASDAWMVPEYRAHVLGDARRQLRQTMPERVGAGLEPTMRVAAGSAANAIRAHAEATNADVIVLGRSTRFMHRGSTAVQILRSTDRAVLVIPPAAGPGLIDGAQPHYRHAA